MYKGTNISRRRASILNQIEKDCLLAPHARRRKISNLMKKWGKEDSRRSEKELVVSKIIQSKGGMSACRKWWGGLSEADKKKVLNSALEDSKRGRQRIRHAFAFSQASALARHRAWRWVVKRRKNNL